MKRRASNIDREYLRRTKAATPEQKLSWLAAAQEFAAIGRRAHKKTKKKAD